MTKKLTAAEAWEILPEKWKFITKNSNGDLDIWGARPVAKTWEWSFNGDYTIENSNLPLEVDFGTDDWRKCIAERPKPLEFRVGGVYRTRDYRKAFIRNIGNCLAVVIAGDTKNYSLDMQGRARADYESCMDLVAEWS
ncbi:hypothetical protein FACS1894186_5850 [Alphaproteobacteria bacterium]|nr:hypothetical protein FACS1894186_5850 [Alphaproteobacteria bacterium]